MAAIFAAVKAFDAEALRRELAAGGNPDIYEDHHLRPSTPLNYAVCWQSAYSGAKQMRERLECITVLLEAGASVDLVTDGRTPLHWIAGNKSAAYQSVIAMLLEAGADPNFTDTNWHRSVLAKAAENGTAATVRRLICAGAVDLDRALEVAITYGKQRNCAPLLRAGAAIQKIRAGIPLPTHVYIQKICAAGRRRHGGQRRRELRVEIRRGGGRRDRWRAERVGVRGVVGRHARTPPQFLHCFLERRDELVGHVGHLLDFPVEAHGLRRESVLVDRFWGPRGRRRWRRRRRRHGRRRHRGRRPRDASDARGRRGRRARARAAAPPLAAAPGRVGGVADGLRFGPALRPPALRRPVVIARRRRPRHREQEVDFRRRFHQQKSVVITHLKLRALMRLRLGFAIARRRRCFRRVAVMTNLGSFVNRRSRTSCRRQIHGNPFYARGTR